MINACKKVTYTTRAEAKKAAQAVASRFGGKRTPYACHECGLWHLTSQRPGDFREKKKQWRRAVKADSANINRTAAAEKEGDCA
ncbi:hypothetical protein [Roseicella sp. DB1501]|uniref:hypothetical protein n=1 Tax=Roseicella sp. DB1501 TaxID=2730925 RepID=UPI00149243C7|nr:hypothetical protein [Roseicella sp. DB1501]NOG73747.1 hypothetical protein [Roseicella sp. DB1501]